MIITKKEFDYISKMAKNAYFSMDFDFGQRKVNVLRKDKEALINDAFTLSLDEKIKDNCCYILGEDGLEKLIFFSPQTNQSYKLTPTNDWPTISIGSVPMHKLKSAKEDTQSKINLLKPRGLVLDTCMGLGYTAILSSRAAKEVITFERDKNVIHMAKLNPLSKELFTTDNITIRNEDVSLAIEGLKSNSFDCIIHDPPTFKLSPQLFSVSFYNELLRILKKGGRLFHYTPLYRIKRGFNFPQRIKNKLKEARFKVITYSEEAGGWLCQK